MSYTHLSGLGTARTGYKNMGITARTDGERAKLTALLVQTNSVLFLGVV